MICMDCEPGPIVRPAPHPGPRCATHHRAEFLRRKKAKRAKAVEKTYEVTPEEHAAILRAQGGKCYICQRATGASRRLSVDHDHAVEKVHGTRASIRGLLCRPCNDLLGHLRDDPDAFLRGANYLAFRPAQDVLNPVTEGLDLHSAAECPSPAAGASPAHGHTPRI